jgi:tetratricopeptide (TPR) repeat protein
MDLSPDQIEQLKSLGLDISNPPSTISNDIRSDHDLPPTLAQIPTGPVVSTHHLSLLPLLSISGLSLISFGGLLLFKSKSDTAIVPHTPVQNTAPEQVPTQVPKSIQHYLLASQQSFSQALTSQKANNNSKLVELLNQSILTATDAIKEFPTDYRGYQQRASIYLSLINSQPQFLDSAIADYSAASELNPTNAEISRSLATLYAKKGDVDNTLAYLIRTVAIEPTKAQNFYDLARLQQQAGLIPQALDTYTKLLPLVTDSSQKQQITTELSSLEKLVSQNTSNSALPSPSTSPNPPTGGISLPDHPNLIQANSGAGLIIAAPAISSDISVTNLSASNALSGTGTLPANTASVSFSNSHLSPTSQVYLTVIKGGANQSLQVLSRSTDSFTVGLDSPISEEITFKWWIVNP